MKKETKEWLMLVAAIVIGTTLGGILSAELHKLIPHKAPAKKTEPETKAPEATK